MAHYMADNENEYDHIVIGGGSSGCVAAARLGPLTVSKDGGGIIRAIKAIDIHGLRPDHPINMDHAAIPPPVNNLIIG